MQNLHCATMKARGGLGLISFTSLNPSMYSAKCKISCLISPPYHHRFLPKAGAFCHYQSSQSLFHVSFWRGLKCATWLHDDTCLGRLRRAVVREHVYSPTRSRLIVGLQPDLNWLLRRLPPFGAWLIRVNKQIEPYQRCACSVGSFDFLVL